MQVLYDFLVHEAITPQYLEGGEQENYAGIILTGFSYLTLLDTVSPGVNADKAKKSGADNGNSCHILIYKVKQSFIAMIMYDGKFDINICSAWCYVWCAVTSVW